MLGSILVSLNSVDEEQWLRAGNIQGEAIGRLVCQFKTLIQYWGGIPVVSHKFDWVVSPLMQASYTVK